MIDLPPEAYEMFVPPYPAASVVIEVGTSDGVSENVRVAAEKIDGARVEPWGRFSFNRVVGERTRAAGFVDSTILFAGVESTGLGGGVCQVSTALYMALMRGGYRVVERWPHSRPRVYADLGEDSAVNWPDLDLEFVNDSIDPLLVTAFVGFDPEREREVLSVVLWTRDESRAAARSVETEWRTVEVLEPEERSLESRFARRRVLHDGGAPGVRGVRYWWRGVPYPVVAAPSRYPALPRVFLVPPGLPPGG